MAERASSDEGRSSRWRRAAIVVAAWSLVALAWTPPTFLIGPRTSQPLWVLVFTTLGFVPWMAATPFFLWFGRRFTIAPDLRNIWIHALAGVIGVPIVELAASLLSSIALIWRGAGPDVFAPAHLATNVAITSLYGVPTYVALVAVIQGRVFLETFRARERLLARAQLQALQAQINPHFLFNTLNAISALGYREPAKADRALAELSQLLRASLADAPEQTSLREEIAFARSYADLYALLMSDRLDVTFDIDAKAWQAAVPRMMLQPLVENAIVHGVAGRLGRGAILVRARVREGALTIEVRNDVDGAQPSSGAGIGLANVRERLQVLYGTRQSLRLEPRDGGMTVSIVLPYVPASEAPQAAAA